MRDRRITILDTTLRDGNQAPDLLIPVKDRLSVADRLFAAGVDEIEAGIPAIGEQEREFMRTLSESYPDKRITAWCRLKELDVSLAKETGVNALHLCLPFSDYHLEATGMSWDEVRERLALLIEKHRADFDHISIGLQDAFRVTLQRFDEVRSLVSSLSIERIRISDTVGTASPSQVSRLITSFTEKEDAAEIEFHAHNDFGLATANTLAAVEAGAGVIDVTVNGIGERAGNCSLAEIAVLLGVSEHYTTGIDLEKLYRLSLHVSQITGRPLPVDKPLVGEAVFTHTSGIHCHAMQFHKLAYQPLPASIVGR